MVVSTNVPALNTSLSMRRADRGMQAAMRRLSTGMRINSAREDAAGLSIANKLTYQVGGLMRASENATHGNSLIQTAEGAMTEIHNMLQRMRELAVQAANDTLTNHNKATIQLEIDQLIEEIHEISRRTEFNRMRILNGEADRIVENRCHTYLISNQLNNGLTRSVVTPTFISSNIAPGQIRYTIEEVGRHAVQRVEFADGPLPAGQITVNGISLNVAEGTSLGDFLVEFNQVLEFAGITKEPSGAGDDHFYLVSVLAGSNQHITIGGSAGLLSAIGLSGPTHETGSNARVTIDRVYDINNIPINGYQAWAISTNGNQVTIRGTSGEEIRMNIQVAFSATAASHHVFPDSESAPTDLSTPQGDLIDDGTGTLIPDPDDPPLYNPRKMHMDIRNFGPLMLQIGPGHNMAMSVQIPRINAETLGLAEFVGGRKRIMVNYRNTAGASAAINIADRAINHVSSVRSRLGAYQNRLESTIRNLDITAENTEMSRSRIQDTDIARESTRFATYNVMMQAAQAILAQANQRPQMLVSLLQ